MKKILFDVGANNGSTSLSWSYDKNNLVYAFEPTPQMYQQIESKIVGVENYFLVKKAVSNYNGNAIFNIAGNADWGCSSLLEFSEKSQTEWPGRSEFYITEKIEVDVIRLDSFVQKNNIDRIDYIHVDTQGSDLKVLIGLGDFIDIVQEGVIEAATKKDILYYGQCTKDECIDFLEKNGFIITKVESNDPHTNEVNIFFKKIC